MTRKRERERPEVPLEMPWLNWGALGFDEGGLPVHLPMTVNPAGDGPAIPEEAHHLACWCQDRNCPLTLALDEAWQLGCRMGVGMDEAPVCVCGAPMWSKACLGRGHSRGPQPRPVQEPVVNTKEQNIAFRKYWDELYEQGQQKRNER